MVLVIDIVLIIDEKYYISIENKIYVSSVSEDQLKIQYECLKRQDGIEKIIMVYLVPFEQGNKINNEFNNLIVQKRDKKEKITWNDISDNIIFILNEEHNCNISPLGEYLRHTLKALAVFIKGDFKGFITEKDGRTYKMNPKAMEERKNYATINSDENITYIGVPRGKNELYKMDIDELKEKEFQCTMEKNPPNRFWVERNVFLDIVQKRSIES